MYKFTVKDLVEYSRGILLKGNLDDEITNIVIDSRKIKNNTLYIPIIGENNDGHDYLEDAYQNGARTFLIDKNHSFDKQNINLIKVDNTTKAFGYITKGYKEKFNIPFVGVTGSIGKTTTKDMIYGVLSKKYNTLKNEGNFNNEIGVPKTLLNLDSSIEVAVIEMGMSYKGEIKHLSYLVNPDIAVISNIGMSHIEHFDNQDGIFNAKMEITSNFDKDNLLIVNGDDEYLKKVKDSNLNYKVLSYGFNSYNDIYCTDYEILEDSTNFKCIINEKEESFTIPSPAKHNVLNALAAILVGLNLGLDINLIKEGLSTFSLSKGRLDIFKTDKYRIINDTYNASCDSMIGALNVLNNYSTRKVAILGDIFELGSYSEELHRKVGKEIKDNVDVLITIGEASKYINEEASPKEKYHFPNIEDCEKELFNILKDEDTILVKASNGMKLIQIVDFLR